MSVAGFAARQTERMAVAMAHFIASTPEDRLVWHPSIPGGAPTRSILEQASECVVVNRYFAALIRGNVPETSAADYPELTLANGQDAQEQLIASSRELSAAIETMTDADLARTYPHRKGPVLGENLILMSYRNMAYHSGQANFIQNLYGDAEFHTPPNWR